MPARSLIRIVLSLGVIVVLWIRAASEGGGWLIASTALTVLLGMVVIVEITRGRRKYRSPKEETPKKPLGLS